MQKYSKTSVEGEGPRLGLKTVFFKYPEDKEDIYSIKEKDLNLYINASVVDSALCTRLKLLAWKQDMHITLEIDFEPPVELLSVANILIFRNVIKYERDLLKHRNLFIKIRVLRKKDFTESITVANLYAKERPRNVLLMPEFKCDYKKLIEGNLDKIGFGVRFMPPVQQIINIV